MAENEVKLMKGNEVIAHAAIRYGCDGYFGYPITPQSEVMETLMELKPWETTGMVVLQAESEISSINMVYGGASTGKRVMTSSSSPGISLMSEGLSYLAGAELPCLIVNCQRGGPGLGTIQPSQGDYFQACKGGGHGDFHMIVLAPNSVQEMHDHVFEAFDLAFKYRNPALILADGAIGQMMEKVVLAPQRPRKTDEELKAECGAWAAQGKPAGRARNIVTSLELQSEKMEVINKRLQEKYKALEENEVRYEAIECDDADYVIVAFGSSARICSATVEMARAEGLKVGLLRPITLYPFPKKQLAEMAARGVKGFLSAELNAGQMVEDVRLAVNGKAPVEHYGRQGGMMFNPDEVLDALKEKLIKKKKTMAEVEKKTENLVYAKPKLITDNVMHYCPGCSHGTVHKLIAEVIEEMGLAEKTVGISPVGCSVFAYNYIDIDWIEAAHGRALAVATAVKRLYPQNMVFTYQGDGDLSAIGTAESIHAAARGENVVAVYINNAIYGMTGGQMAPTTLLGMKTATTPYGRDPRLNGYPYKIAEMMAHLDGATYITRQSVHTAANVRKCKKAIRKAFENSMAGNGFSLVEVVSTCNSGWKLSPVASNQWLAENMLPFYPLGDIKDVKKE